VHKGLLIFFIFFSFVLLIRVCNEWRVGGDLKVASSR